jgi:hypothetical protein
VAFQFHLWRITLLEVLMKKLFAFTALFVALLLPHFAQAQIRLSLSDQRRFDSYYSRWQSYKATNNQSQVRSMEGRMQDVYRHYGIPANTPYRSVASGGGSGTWGNGTWNGSPSRSGDRDWDRDHEGYRDRDRDRDHDREWDRDRDRDHDRDDDGDRHHDNGKHRGWYKHHHGQDNDDREDHDRDHDD